MQIYCKSDSNDSKTWWNIYSYIEYELIVQFQLQLRILICVISQKTFEQVFHSNEHKCVEKKHFVIKLLSFEKWEELLQPFVSRSILYVYQNARWNQRKISPKLYPKKIYFLA
jgi:hypothetical protein